VVVFGLGNPGPRYADTRHNIGWRVIEALVARWRAERGPDQATHRWWRAERGGTAVALVEPQTYMNLSGDAVAAWRDGPGLEPGSMLVVLDDVYLPLGTLRLRARGSSGGHRGLESIEAALGSSDYPRLRIGVGEAGSSELLRDHVLETFGPEERETVEAAIESAADAVECWVGDGIVAAMNRYNKRVQKEASES
jgi:PTH1 family peptidyl-tRNA hydrolase